MESQTEIGHHDGEEKMRINVVLRAASGPEQWDITLKIANGNGNMANENEQQQQQGTERVRESESEKNNVYSTYSGLGLTANESIIIK